MGYPYIFKQGLSKNKGINEYPIKKLYRKCRRKARVPYKNFTNTQLTNANTHYD